MADQKDGLAKQEADSDATTVDYRRVGCLDSPRWRRPPSRLPAQTSTTRRESSRSPTSPMGTPRERAWSATGGPGGSRLVRWAAAFAGGKAADTPAGSTFRQSGGPSIPDKSSDMNGYAGSGGDPAAGEGLYAQSPVRHRFRPIGTRKLGPGWSSSSNIAGRGGSSGSNEGIVAGADDDGPRVAMSRIVSNILVGPLAMRLIRRLKMAAALVALAVAGLGALMVGCCLYLTVRPWGRATYRRFLCSQLAAPLVDSAALLLPRTRVRVTGDSDMPDGLCPGVIVSNTLPGNAFLGLDWWAILMVVRAIGAHGCTKVLVRERLNQTPVLGWILRILEFPGVGDCYQADRDRIKERLASFAQDSVSAGQSGVPYLFLHFPEGDTLNRETLASSLDFAKREGRPELMRLLLPHTTVLSACLDGLRPAKPVIYDVTLATAGYNGEVPRGRPPSDWDILRDLATGRAWDSGKGSRCSDASSVCRDIGLSKSTSDDSVNDGFCGDPMCSCRVAPGGTTGVLAPPPGGALGFSGSGIGNKVLCPPDTMGLSRSLSLGEGCRNGVGSWTDKDEVSGSDRARLTEEWGRGSHDIHVRIKRYSLEEVAGNTHWLDDCWAEKERLLAYFARHQSFPSDGRGFPARRTLDTRGGQFEGSAMAFVRLSAVLFLVPLMSLAAIPFVVAMALAALTYRAISAVVRAVASRILPRRSTRRRWWGARFDDEEDELGQGTNDAQSTLTPWWGGPTTPLNTPAPGATGSIPYMSKTSNRGRNLSGHDYLSNSS